MVCGYDLYAFGRRGYLLKLCEQKGELGGAGTCWSGFFLKNAKASLPRGAPSLARKMHLPGDLLEPVLRQPSSSAWRREKPSAFDKTLEALVRRKS